MKGAKCRFRRTIIVETDGTSAGRLSTMPCPSIANHN
jgi:hypothetical protein